MALAVEGGDVQSIGRAYLANVHPVFMLPPIAAAAFGAILAREVAPLAATVHVIAIFCAVYTAHLKDGYIDYYVRTEDQSTTLTPRGFWIGLLLAGGGMFACLLVLYHLVDIWAVALTLPGWLIGYLHAPHLDTNPVTTTIGYPTGIALAILGGYYVQVQALSVEAMVLGAIFLVLLSGVKIVDDLQDYRWDLRNQKHSAGVTLGITRAHRLALGMMVIALAGIILGSVLGVIAPASAVAAAIFAPVLYLAHRREPGVQTRLLIRGTYLFLAVLVAVAWWRPLA